MKKGLLELVFILDASGSMHHLTDDTIGGYNSLLEKQKSHDGDVLVSLVSFNNCSRVIYDRVPISEIKPMTRKDYCAEGCTALTDAIGGAIHHISNVHKYIREEDRPENTLFVVTTDGMENASHSYTREKVKKMIEEKEALGWEFLFLGANIDAESTAEDYGICKEHTANFVADPVGMSASIECLETVIKCKRENLDLFSAGWSKTVDDDYEARIKK